MNKDFEQLQDLWEQSKEDIAVTDQTTSGYATLIDSKKLKSKQFHFGNIFVLLLTLVVIVTFFIFIAPVRELVSRIGAGIMIFGLILRILIEFYSIRKARQLNPALNALSNLEESIKYLKLRKWIHKELTIGILISYTIGLLMIAPEFQYYLGTLPVIIFYGMFVISGAIIIWKIRKQIKQELLDIQEIINLKKQITTH
ncbi:hypothetical protein ABN763_13235 [Spongiivirga sp. MCCC 1A20706]|uniref:hypothetical protein n=1 Tax=Spongiivirga sp. MCCC 1A20706 TaxID=3160963 RepID=UPI003977B5C4